MDRGIMLEKNKKKKIIIIVIVIVAMAAAVLSGFAVSALAFASGLKKTGYPIGEPALNDASVEGENAFCRLEGDTATVYGAGETHSLYFGYTAYVNDKARNGNPFNWFLDVLFVKRLHVKKVVFGPEIRVVDEFFFENCPWVEEIEVDENNPYLCAVDGVLFNKTQTTLLAYPPGREEASYIVPSGVTEIRDTAFEDPVFLKEVTVPDSVTVIEDWAIHFSAESGQDEVQSVFTLRCTENSAAHAYAEKLGFAVELLE